MKQSRTTSNASKVNVVVINNNKSNRNYIRTFLGNEVKAASSLLTPEEKRIVKKNRTRITTIEEMRAQAKYYNEFSVPGKVRG